METSMIITGKFLVVGALILALATPALGGRLSNQLQDRLAGGSDTDLVPVWIKLKPVEGARHARSLATSSSLSLDQRHAAAIRGLKDSHARAQREVLAKLSDLEHNGRAQNIRSFWITNLVAATVKANELERLAALPEVETVRQVPVIRSITPERTATPVSLDATADSIGAHLDYINADQAWSMGYTGADRLLCTFDSGIDGDHPAFADRWRGLDGNVDAAWFDPVGKSSTPSLVLDSWNREHGTWVLGMAVGDDPVTGFRTGVAFEAEWISAAVTDLPTMISHALLEAFEWAADPDGDPNTVADRPDVINHSWGYSPLFHDIICEDIFFDAIDNIEALGIVNIFAAGNDGSILNAISNPANRALDSVDCFAVGATNAYGPLAGGSAWKNWANPDSVRVASFSSRGPSDCDGFSTKPNVVAPEGNQGRNPLHGA
jgi:bacillopeptidase F